MPRISKSKASPKSTVYAKTYRTFLGVDFSTDASLVDEKRSPDAENIISDLDGFPEKRVGWRVLNSFDGKINGIYTFKDKESSTLIVHAGEKIYKVSDGILTEIYSGCADSKSNGICFKGKLCILTGSEFLVFDGESCVHAKDAKDMYAPITHIQRKPIMTEKNHTLISTVFQNWNEKGEVPTGTEFGTVPVSAEINLVSGKRKNTFEWGGESGSAIFILDKKIDKDTRVIMKCLDTGKTLFDILFSPERSGQEGCYQIDDKHMTEDDKDGINLELIQYFDLANSKLYLTIGNSEKNDCGFVAIRPNITKNNIAQHIPGTDNFSIEFTHEIEGYAERIEKCRFMDVFENRVFFSGNPDFPNADWYSAVNDPLFVPDLNYTEIGLDSSEIMGYLRTGSEQAVLKSDGDGATIYMRSYGTLSDGSVIFPLAQGTSGLGAVARGAMTTFLDDPVYLTRNGVYAIALQNISNERALNLRSTRINSRLLLEENLSDAIMCEWEGYLLLCTNGNCYVADAAQRTYSQNKTATYEYEWYYWTNIPAVAFCVSGEVLYFGTEDGRLCRFNNDMKNSRGEILSKAYSDDGAAICARWATPLSDDGDFMRLKTMAKVGSGVFLKSYSRSGASVCIRTDADFEREIAGKSAGVFNFEDINFEDFTFNTSPYTVVPFNQRIKKYKAIQIICKNEKLNHAFGIGGIIRKYFYGKTNK